MENKKTPDIEEIRILHFNDIFQELDYWLEFDKKQTFKTLKAECRDYGIEIKNINEFWQFFNNNAFDFGYDLDEILLETVNTMQDIYNVDIWSY